MIENITRERVKTIIEGDLKIQKRKERKIQKEHNRGVKKRSFQRICARNARRKKTETETDGTSEKGENVEQASLSVH